MTVSCPMRRALKRPRNLAFLPLILVVIRIDAFVSLDGPQRRQSNSGEQQRQLWSTPKSENPEANHVTSEHLTKPFQRHRQRRRKPENRRPRYYWLDRTNLRHELYQFWSTLGILTDRAQPAIPNERLLMYYGRHDLRAAIVKNGGRISVSQLLNDAPIIPGPWKTAVRNSPELQQLIRNNHTGLSPERPPRIDQTSSSSLDLRNFPKLWSHQTGRNRKGHWSLQMVIQELYEYVDQYKLQNNRPSVWMPRPSELAASGHDDLRQAINRYGGTQGICRTAGMVPYREWFYFEGQLELFSELKRYLDDFADGDYTTFPTVSDVRRNGFEQLHALIQYYGGRKFLAARLSMSEQKYNGSRAKDASKGGNQGRTIGPGYDTCLKFGLFDLEFAVRLLTFIRNDQMKRSPPLQSPVLSMPSRTKLLTSADDGAWLDAKIDEFGGYENVARRLGLALFSSSGNGKDGR